MIFDSYAMVDWSAANVPCAGRDSIWICWLDSDGERLDNPPTRREARALIAHRLAAARAKRERVLVGFDFPFGYPSGFAGRLGLAGPPWRAVWDEIDRLVEDGPDNRNNRFAVAAALNRRISAAAFPFWGCPANRTGPCLAPTRPVYGAAGLAEWRLIDRRDYLAAAQPCWKLAYPGSVGSQSLTGIPVVRALRDDSRWRDTARVWPFETGLGPPGEPEIVFAEVYPSFWRSAIRPQAGEPKDAAQVRFVSRFFAARDREDGLARLFAGDPGLSPAQRRTVENEEAWTLGVTAPRQAGGGAAIGNVSR
jgi:precorrin-8X/cobalt-precorrin-8 methylmutase